jgi:predicted ribosomally synthesized peptide with nif11-like leader
MTETRAKALSEFLTADADRAKDLLTKEPEEALKVINANGFDFTVDELKEFGAAVRKAAEADELSEASLEGVSGGVITESVIGIAFVGTVLFAAGQRIGKYAPW